MSQDDILSYIVTGRPASDNPLAGQGSGTSGGQAVAVGALDRRAWLEHRRQRARLRRLPDPAGPSPGAHAHGGTLRRLQACSSSLQLPLQSGGSRDRGCSRSSGPGFELEYSLERWLSSTLRGGSLPVGFLFRGRHAY